MSKICDAERAIARILQQLEVDTQSVVEEVTLKDVEITGLESERQTFARRVRLELKRLPGACWLNANE